MLGCMEAKDSAAAAPLAALPLLTSNHAAEKTSIDLRRGIVASDPTVVAGNTTPSPGVGAGGGGGGATTGGGASKNPSSSPPPPPPPSMSPPPMMLMIQQQSSAAAATTTATTATSASTAATNNGNGNGSTAATLPTSLAPAVAALTTITTSVSGGGGGGAIIGGVGSPFHGSTLTLGTGGLLKRKRGRPRKYVEGSGSPPVLIMNSPPPLSGGAGASPPVVSGLSAISGLPTPPSPLGVALALAPLAASSSAASPAAAAAQLAYSIGGSAVAPPASGEKKRGRPPGSGKKQLAALGAYIAGSAGQNFTPHIITIAAGEDVATRIISFAQIGPRATCVLSANGAISNVTLRQPATSGGTVTYEGRFEILSLSGSFLLTENGNTKSRSGGLSVSLAGPDGRVIGGSVAGLLIAASPVQVVVGSFVSESRKPPQVQVYTRPNSASSGEMVSGMVNSPLSTTRPATLGSGPLNDHSGSNPSAITTTTTNINSSNATNNATNNATTPNNAANNASDSNNNNNSSSPVHHHHHHHHHMGWSSSSDDQQQQQQNQGGGHGTDINISLPGS